MVSHEIVYNVSFRPGRYRWTRKEAAQPYYAIGRVDDGVVIGFAFSQQEAEHICLGLNLADAVISGNREDARALLKSLESLRTH